MFKKDHSGCNLEDEMRGNRTVQAYQKGCCRWTGDSGYPEQGMVVRVEKRLMLKKSLEPKDIHTSARLGERALGQGR